ncbi:MAG: methylmalonyl-CoA mutase subunit beta [Candidatus Methanolliviera sp. GoM_asphalt]|nr:MAG: methylmalonyl-CoA mutase subunit beta [Candidatus Methanolliviera sp. GoM_asphalt]
MSGKIRVLTGKIGLDDHFRGIISVTEALKDAGMEVIYVGAGRRIDEMITAAIQENVQVIGLSFLCGGHLETMQRFMDKMKEQGLDNVLVVIGGVIHDQDIPKLKELGVAEVFLPGTPLKDIVKFVLENVKNKRE